MTASHNSDSMEKDYGQGGRTYHMGPNEDSQTALHRIKTANSITISPELFEKLYLQPQNNVKGDLRMTFANPTPLALIGFVMALTPLSFSLMGIQGAGLFGQAAIGTYWFFGGLLMFIAGIGEWILGNTFPSIVFGSYGAYWFAYGAVLTPAFNSYAAYAPGSADPLAGLWTQGFNASLGFFDVFMAVLSFMYLICALRTNIVFVLIFLGLTLDFVFLAAVDFKSAHRNAAPTTNDVSALQMATGALCFATVIPGWYIFFAQMLASVDFPLSLPVGDLSHIIRGASEKEKDHAV
ncbi:MAG: hypothetical protein M1814_000387 [Vezdaea aestivalis]|nr:MAG: hypothetical protein M1814_000387 [Vezdaea aestivalis]